MSTPTLRVAVVGAGPAIYAADILSKTDLDVSIDLFERLPRRSAWCATASRRTTRASSRSSWRCKVLQAHHPPSRTVDYGTDLKARRPAPVLRDAVIFSTGSIRDAALPIPGIDLGGSYGAADFVSWYDGHPDVPRTWPLEAQRRRARRRQRRARRRAHPRQARGRPAAFDADKLDILGVARHQDVHVFCARADLDKAKFSPPGCAVRHAGRLGYVIVYKRTSGSTRRSTRPLISANQTSAPTRQDPPGRRGPSRSRRNSTATTHPPALPAPWPAVLADGKAGRAARRRAACSTATARTTSA